MVYSPFFGRFEWTPFADCEGVVSDDGFKGLAELHEVDPEAVALFLIAEQLEKIHNEIRELREVPHGV